MWQGNRSTGHCSLDETLVDNSVSSLYIVFVPADEAGILFDARLRPEKRTSSDDSKVHWEFIMPGWRNWQTR